MDLIYLVKEDELAYLLEKGTKSSFVEVGGKKVMIPNDNIRIAPHANEVLPEGKIGECYKRGLPWLKIGEEWVRLRDIKSLKKI